MSKRDDERCELLFIAYMCFIVAACCFMVLVAIVTSEKECVDEETFITYTAVDKAVVPQKHTNCLKYKED